MKQMKKLLSGVVVAALLSVAEPTIFAEDSTNQTTTAASAPVESLYQPFTVGAEVGTTGYGGDIGWRFMDHFGVGAAFDYLSFSLNNRSIQDATYNGNLRLQSETVTLDLYPGRRSSFHVSVGVLLNQDQLTGNALVNDFQGSGYNGTLNLNIKYQPVDPYVGIGGNVYFDRGHHFSLFGTLGAAYFGNSKVSLTSNPNDPSGTVLHEQSQVQKYANDLRVFPVIKAGFNFSF